jgi:uncharacterized protein
MAEPAAVIVFGCLAIGLAGLVFGLTGFGFALVTAPLLILVLAPKVVVPIVTLLSNVGHVILLVETYRWIRIKRVWLLMLGGIIGAQVGTYLLLVISPSTLKVLIGSVTLVSAVAMLLGVRRPIKNEHVAALPVGFVSGILGGSTSMSGPPVVLFYANQGVDKAVFRANLNLYFTILTLATLPSQIVAGLMTDTVVSYALLMLPVLILGTIAGIRLAHRVNEDNFRRLTLMVVIASAVLAMAAGLGWL